MDNFTADAASFDKYVGNPERRYVVYSFALKLTSGDSALAEDITQDTLVKAWGAWERFTPNRDDVAGAVKSWLFAIASNVHNDVYRAADAKQMEFCALGDAALNVEQPPLPLKAGTAERVLDNAIRALPDEFRDTAYLLLVESMTYAQISQVTSAPIGTVMSRISRARRRMKQDPALLEFVKPARGSVVDDSMIHRVIKCTRCKKLRPESAYVVDIRGERLSQCGSCIERRRRAPNQRLTALSATQCQEALERARAFTAA